MHVAQSPGRVTFTRTKKLCVDKREAKEASQEARSSPASMVYVLLACCDSCITQQTKGIQLQGTYLARCDGYLGLHGMYLECRHASLGRRKRLLADGMHA